jgi:outer membrane protein OmpA-like peptidoglycan-associated protein
MNVKSSLAVVLAGATLIFSSGCVSKKYVRQQTEPIIDKSNELDSVTAKNTNDIRDVDTRAQQGIRGVNDKAAAAEQKATEARGRADQAQVLATQAVQRVDVLQNQVANLDSYHSVAETSVQFGFNKADLTKNAKASLDQLLTNVASTKGYIIVLEGGTDSVGSASYNYQLSERRADAVVQYLAENNIPAHKIYVIGLGKDKTVAPNTTADGRAKNRRVDVRLMTNSTGTDTAPAQKTAPDTNR